MQESPLREHPFYKNESLPSLSDKDKEPDKPRSRGSLSPQQIDESEYLALQKENQHLSRLMKEMSFLIDQAVPGLQKRFIKDIYPKTWQQYVKSKKVSEDVIDNQLNLATQRQDSLKVELMSLKQRM